jgi:dihydroorotase
MLTRRKFSQMCLATASAVLVPDRAKPTNGSPAYAGAPRNEGSQSSDQKYDLLIQGGTVIDPSQKLHAPLDVAVMGSKIVEIAKDIPANRAIKVVSAKDKIVTPGWIDLQVHCFEGIVSGINADHYCLSRGTTTVVENGGIGSIGLDGVIKYIVEPSITRIFVGLNIFPPGYSFRPLPDDPDAMKPELAAKAALDNKPVVVSIKAYVEKNHVGTRDLESLTKAMEAAEMSRLPLVADINDSYSPLPKIISKLRKGDVFSHYCSDHPHGILDANGRILPEVLDARARGVLFDTAEGGGQVSFEVADKCLQQDFLPDTISTDLLEINVDKRVFDLPTAVSKFMALGMDLDKAIERVTSKPAQVFDYGVKIGTLRPGSEADIGVFELRDGNFEFLGSNDSQKRTGHKMLVNKAVICRGKYFVNAV